jgi:hypothetical protein
LWGIHRKKSRGIPGKYQVRAKAAFLLTHTPFLVVPVWVCSDMDSQNVKVVMVGIWDNWASRFPPSPRYFEEQEVEYPVPKLVPKVILFGSRRTHAPSLAHLELPIYRKFGGPWWSSKIQFESYHTRGKNSCAST